MKRPYMHIVIIELVTMCKQNNPQREPARGGTRFPPLMT